MSISLLLLCHTVSIPEAFELKTTFSLNPFTKEPVFARLTTSFSECLSKGEASSSVSVGEISNSFVTKSALPPYSRWCTKSESPACR